MLQLPLVVDQTSLIDGAAEESGCPLVAGEAGSNREEQEVNCILVNAEGSAVVQVEWANEDSTSQVVEASWSFNIGDKARIRGIELVRLIVHFLLCA